MLLKLRVLAQLKLLASITLACTGLADKQGYTRALHCTLATPMSTVSA
ncbi:hypothetical protein L195_g063198, partial [Trifolium pratense]